MDIHPKYLVVVVDTTRRGFGMEQIGGRDDYEQAKALFLDTCRTRCSNWDEYTPDDIDILLDEGYFEYGSNMVVCFLDLTNLPDMPGGLVPE